MIRISRVPTILGATALLTLSLVMPATANDEPSGSTVGFRNTRSLSDGSSASNVGSASDVSSANVPLPRSRPASVRKRVANEWPVARPTPRQIAWFFGPYRPVVASHWPVLMLGIGF